VPVLGKEAVSVVFCAAVVVNESEVGERLHVGGLVAPEGEVVTQLSVTVPLNELPGVTAMVEEPGEPLAMAKLVGLLVRVKLVLLLPPPGACQKSPQPAKTQTERPTSTDAASTHFRCAHPSIFIAAPLLSSSVVGCL
jgi:hypothetical protein